MANVFRGAIWPAATLRFGGLAAGALLFEWLLFKGAHLLRWGWNDPRTVESDVVLYFEWVTAIVAGRSPYIDFPVPYPPVALMVTLLPGVLARSYSAYLIAYSLLMFAASAVLFALTESYARLLHKDVKQTLGWLTAFLVPLSGLILWRFDIVVAVTTIGALLLLAGARPGAAGSVAALGALVKLVPALVLAVPLLRLHREARPALRSVFIFLLTIAIVCTAWFAYAGPSLYTSFRMHSQRGLEFGSLSAGVLLLLGQFFPQSARVVTTNPCLCVEVDHAWAPSLAAAALPLQAIALSLAAIWIFLQRRRNDARDLSLLFFLYILTGKVLSPQYLIWTAPFVAFLPRLRLPFLVACILTTAVYPIGFDLLRQQVAWPIVALNVRNALLIYCVCLIVSPTRTPAD